MARAGGRCRRPGSKSRVGAGAPFPLPPPPSIHRRRHGGPRLGPVSPARLDCTPMIYVCVPVHNEAKTAGLVLWKVRQVFTAFAREYQIIACNDGSTDGTADVLARYARVLPMTIVTHPAREGYARSVEELLRIALQRTDRPKRDSAILLHADFVHAPEAMEEMVKRLESGADLVVGEQARLTGAGSRGFRWVRRLAPRLLPVAGVRDSVSGFTALRLIVLRQALRADERRALVTTDGWCANAELLARLAPHARRLETVSTTARYDLQQRPSRIRPWTQLVAAWKARGVVRAARRTAVAAARSAATTAALLCLALPLRGQSDSTPPAVPPLPACPCACACRPTAFPLT